MDHTLQVNKKTDIHILKEIKTKLNPRNHNETTHYERIYRVYLGKIGVGNRPVLVFVDGYDQLGLGDQELYLQPLKFEQQPSMIEHLTEHDNYEEDVRICCKELNITVIEEGIPIPVGVLLSNLIDLQQTNSPLLFKPGLGMPRSELTQFPNILAQVREALKANLEKDPLMDYLFSGHVPRVNPQKIKPREYMQYAPHSIKFTNTKAGKTSNATRTGKVLERFSEAHLLGYSTANERIPGALDGATETTFFDEIQEEKDEELLGKMHTYMEIGETHIGRGRGVRTQGWSALCFMGNPKSPNGQTSFTDPIDQVHLLESFIRLLWKITSNFQAFGSRIGIIFFRNNLKAVHGLPPSRAGAELNEAFIQTIGEGFRDEFTSLFHDEIIRTWLQQPFDEAYRSQLVSIAKNVNSREISQFIKGHMEAHRHTKGFALRLAWLDYVAEYIKTGTIDSNSICELGKKHLQDLQQVNLASFVEIARLEENELYQEYLKSAFENLKPRYVYFFLRAVFEWYAHNQEKKLAAFDELSNYYSAATTGEDAGKYEIFSKTREKIEGAIDASNDALYPYGLKIIIPDETAPAVVIDDLRKFKKSQRVYISRGLGTKGLNGLEESESTKKTQTYSYEEHS